MDEAGWHRLDSQIDQALHAVRADKPDQTKAGEDLTALSNSLQ
ncbi:hypothetical protein OG976_20830 [Mycobacterium sp. NBC_00419]